MALIEAGPLHRLALVVADSGAAETWFHRIFGAGCAVPDLPLGHPTMLWHGGYPLLLLSPPGPEGFVVNFFRRWGPGVHSLAWQTPDLWAADEGIRHQGVRIVGVNIRGRHFFMDPRDTNGMLIEWTDDFFEMDVRRGGPVPDESDGVVKGARIAWVTAVVSDAYEAAHFLSDTAGAVQVFGNAQRDPRIETTVDLQIGDVVVRLVTPRSEESAYAEVLNGGPRFWSYSLRLPELDGSLSTLEREGIVVLGRDGNLAWTDPTTTLGIPMELTT